MLKRIVGVVLAAALVLCFGVLFSTPAYAASEMKASDECIKMIQDSEGFRAIPYWDYSQWTVGFGTACPEEDLDRYLKEGIPVEEAQALFVEQLAKFEKAVNKFIDKHSLSLSQQQFDALVSFTYNLGSGSLNKETYTIVEAILSGATENEMVYAFSVYCMAGGEFLSGLMRRRMAEANLFLNGVYSEYAPESFCYVHYNANGGVRDASAQGYDANLQAVPLSTPTYEGYTFVGWYTEKEGGVKVTSLDETTHGMTLYAHWEKNNTQADEPTQSVDGLDVTVTGAVVHVRSGPGMAYGISTDVYAGEVLTITGTTEANGLLWGLYSGGWICLDHTNYSQIVDVPSEEDGEVLPVPPVNATVIDPAGITIYTGPHSTYPQVKTLSQDTVIELEEIMLFSGKAWARCGDGWVRVDSSLLVHDADVLAHPFQVTTTTSGLTVRVEPNASAEKATTLSKGAERKVYAVVCTDGVYWGRIYEGWISLDYTNFDSAKLEQYQNHTYGEWYTYTPSNCVTHGQQRRDCQYCDAYESQEAELGDHVMGQWEVTREATCTDDGEEYRKCQYCDHSETRAITATGHSMGDWVVVEEATPEASGEERRSCQRCEYYETRELTYSEHNFGEWQIVQEATCTQAGLERRECADCGYYEQRELSALGHSYGQWYESLAPTYTDYGQERRDCANCDSFEIRQTDKLPPPTVTRIYATVTCDILRIRSGPGTSYKQVGKLYEGDEVEILETATVGKNEWGRITEGWICLTDYTTLRTVEESGHTEHDYGEWYEVVAPTTTSCGQERRDCKVCGHYELRETDMLTTETVEKVYATVTYETVTIRKGPGTSYSKLGSLRQGTVVEILEQKTVGSRVWGRISMGWICLTGHTSLATVTEEVSEQPQTVTMTVNTSSLKIRAGSGTSYSILGYLYDGVQVQVYEIITVKNMKWARIAEGWVCADYLK